MEHPYHTFPRTDQGSLRKREWKDGFNDFICLLCIPCSACMCAFESRVVDVFQKL